MADDEVVSAWNPLDDLGIAQQELNETIVEEFEVHEGQKLPEPRSTFYGCGVYGLYYYGDYEHYEPISNDKGEYDFPIYIGKAVPKGSRTGGAHLDSSTGKNSTSDCGSITAASMKRETSISRTSELNT